MSLFRQLLTDSARHSLFQDGDDNNEIRVGEDMKKQTKTYGRTSVPKDELLLLSQL